MAKKRFDLTVLPGAQAEFVRSEIKYPASVSGRGSGKTVASLCKMFLYATNHSGSLGCMTSPTYTQLRDNLLPAFEEKFDAVRELWEFKRADMELRFVNGSKVLLRPAMEPDKLRGLTLAFAGMDEVAAEGDQFPSFLILQAALRQRGFPHQMWVTTTPQWRRPWIRSIWQDKRNPVTKAKLPEGEYQIYRASTEENFYLPEGFRESIRALAPSERQARQELYGEFIDVEGVAFPQFSERTHVRMPPEGMKVKKRVIGVDFGGRVPTAVEEFCLLENGEIQGTYEFYQRDCSEKQLVDAIADRPRVKVLCDPSGNMQIDQLKRYGINAVGARSNKFDMRKRLWKSRLDLMNRTTGKVYEPGEAGSEYAKPGIYISPLQSNLIAELSALAHASFRGTEMLKDQWEQGLDDHAYDAGAYCLMELDPAAFHVKPLNINWRIA